MWELEYRGYRYLENIQSEKLQERYYNIVRNMSRLLAPERDIIPLNSFLSSWYWYRKEFKTRLEFHLRGLSPQIKPPNSLPVQKFSLHGHQSRHPTAGDVLFRFGDSKYMFPLVSEGNIRIGPASQHLQGTPGDPRVDDELRKLSFLPGHHVQITTQFGKQMPIRGDLCRSISAENYYLLCASCGCHPELFQDFNADSCVIIHNPEVFACRINEAAQRQIPGWYFYYNPVHYFDPYEVMPNEPFDPVTCKDFAFAYQMEYRFVWDSMGRGATADYLYLDVGPLYDTAEFVAIPV